MSKYEPGQVWSYKTRPGEESSRLTILEVETHAKAGTLVHVRVSDVKIKKADGILDVIEHLPCAEEALDQSDVELVAEDAELPDFSEGYKLWKEAFDKGQAGAFAVPIAKSIEVMEQILTENG
jgi:hypothetical protein